MLKGALSSTGSRSQNSTQGLCSPARGPEDRSFCWGPGGGVLGEGTGLYRLWRRPTGPSQIHCPSVCSLHPCREPGQGPCPSDPCHRPPWAAPGPQRPEPSGTAGSAASSLRALGGGTSVLISLRHSSPAWTSAFPHFSLRQNIVLCDERDVKALGPAHRVLEMLQRPRSGSQDPHDPTPFPGAPPLPPHWYDSEPSPQDRL